MYTGEKSVQKTYYIEKTKNNKIMIEKNEGMLIK